MTNLAPKNIILETCPACNGVVSPFAEACPNCGHPIGQMKRRARRKQLNQNVTHNVRSIAIKSKHVAKKLISECKPVAWKLIRLGLKIIRYLLALLVLKIIAYVIGVIIVYIGIDVHLATSALLVSLSIWPALVILPGIDLGKKLFGEKPGFIIGRIHLILMIISSVSICHQISEIHDLEISCGNKPEMPLSIAYLALSCIVVFWAVKVWKRTNRTKAELEAQRQKSECDKTESGHE